MDPRCFLRESAAAWRRALSLLLVVVAASLSGPAHAGLSKGDPAPAIEWSSVDGESYTWRELQEDRPLVVVFWATWCGVCKKDWPKLVELHDELEAAEIAPVWAAVSVGEKSAVVSKVAKQRGLVGTQLIDPEEEGFEALGLKYIPHVYVLDVDGTVAYSGRPKVKKLRSILEKLNESRIATEESR